MTDTKQAATFTPEGETQGREVVTMADVRYMVWLATRSNGPVAVKDGGEVWQRGSKVAQLDGEVLGD